jgi:hypothetical protein
MLKTKEKIIYWLEKYNIKNYTINNDMTVDVFDDVKLDDKSLKKTLKEYGLSVGLTQDENIHIISEFAKDNGYKIKFIH